MTGFFLPFVCKQTFIYLFSLLRRQSFSMKPHCGLLNEEYFLFILLLCATLAALPLHFPISDSTVQRAVQKITMKMKS